MNNKEEKLLQVGDVVYCKSRYYGYYQKYVIDRVTAQYAVSGKTRFRRKYYDNYISIVGDRTLLFNTNTYYLETSNIKRFYDRQKMVEFILSAKMSTLPDAVIEQIYSLIKGAKNDN